MRWACFFCDFGHYPPLRNVQINYEMCDVSIFADERPHLRLLAGNKSRFSMEFSLPEKPKAALLEAVHLASSGEDGERISPVSIIVNGKTVVEDFNVGDFNVGKAGFTETRWGVGDTLRNGSNRIDWIAGDIRTHYWLRRATLYACFDREVSVSLPVQQAEHALFWEGRFSQCSYNALASVLDRFYGVQPWTGETEEFEQREFVTALK